MSRIVYRITDEYAIVERKGSTVLYLQWRENGQKRERSTGARDVESAKRSARQLILKHADLRDVAPEEMPISAVIDRYVLQRGAKIASKATAKRAAALWSEFWGGRSLDELRIPEQERFIEWLRDKGYSDGYVRRVVGVGRTAMNRAWKRGEVRQVPFVELPPDGEPFEHVATRAHLVAILNADIPAHVWTYVLIRLCTGCRGDAALELQPFQVDWPTRTIRLNPPGRRQTNKRRPTVPLPHALAAHLTTLQGLQFYAGYQGRPTRSLKTTWRKMRARLALPVWFAPRVLRHTFGAEMRRRAVPGWDVSGQFGHTGQAEATTERYSPHFGERIREAVDAWMEDLARDVPKLRGVMSGTVAATK